jgi:urease accessory protein
MKTSTKLIFTLIAFPMLIPAPAFAHPVQGVGDFYAGMLHPLITIESVLPLVAFSLLAGQQRRESAIPLLAALPIALVIGAVAASLGAVPRGLGMAQLVLTAGLGLLILVARPLGPWVLTALCAAVGIFVGWTNASENLGQVSPLRFVTGFALIGLLLLVYANGLVRNLRAEWARIAIRVVGSWIAAASILVLGLK